MARSSSVVSVLIRGDGSQLSNETRRAASDLTKLGTGVLLTGAVVGAGFLKMGNAASDLAEAANVTGLVFSDARGEIDDFVSSSAAGLGLSERAAREATSTFGGLLDNLGFAQDQTVAWSKDLTTLSADLASAFNTDPEDAVLALGSALRGETEPIRRYNIMLDDAAVRTRAVEMGLAESTAEVDNNAKAQARLSLIMEQSSKYQGDFANTADGAANSQRVFTANLENFQAKIGQGVLPVMTQLLSMGNALFNLFEALPAPVAEVVGFLGALGSGFLIVAGGTLIAIGQIQKLRATLASLNLTMSPLMATLAAVGAAVAIGTYLWNEHSQQAAETKRQVDELSRTMHDAESAVEGLTTSMANAITGEEAERLAEAGVTVDELAEAALGADAAWAEMRDRLLEVGVSAEALDLVRSRALAAAEASEDLEEAGVGASDSMTEVEASAQEVAEAYEDARKALEEYLDEIHGSTDAVLALVDANEDFEDAQRAVTSAQLELLDAQRTYDDAVRAHGRTSSEATAALYELQGAQENLDDAQRDTIRSAQDLEAEQLRLGSAVESGEVSIEDAIGTINRWESEGRISTDTASRFREQVGLLAWQMTTVPQHIRTRIDLDQEEAKRRLQEFLGLVAVLGSSSQAQFIRLGGRARGGPVEAGVPYVVGEEGPEIMVPGTSGTIIPNDKLPSSSSPRGIGAATSGDTYQIVVNAGLGSDPDSLGRELEQILVRLSRKKGRLEFRTVSS